MAITGVEIFGYCASAVIAYSLTQSSIIKLRWFNLFGASSFCVYGIIIGAFPVALLNGFIALTNVFFLRKLLLQTEQNFSILKVNRPSNYVDFFLEFHQQEIKQLFPAFLKVAAREDREYYFLTEHTEVVGMLSGFKNDKGDFVVDFDFVVPAYRDCKLGHYVLGKGQALKQQTQYSSIVATGDSREHQQYLETLGYSPKKNGIWTYDGDPS